MIRDVGGGGGDLKLYNILNASLVFSFTHWGSYKDVKSRPHYRHKQNTRSTRARVCVYVRAEGGWLSVWRLCPRLSAYLRLSTCVCASLSSDSSSSGNPSRLPGQPAPTSWCMRSRWSGVAATTAQPYLITNKRVVPSVRYQAFSTKQTVIPASQTLALLSLPGTWRELHWDRRLNYTPCLTSISTTCARARTHNPRPPT